jgi:hypothetical protein
MSASLTNFAHARHSIPFIRSKYHREAALAQDHMPHQSQHDKNSTRYLSTSQACSQPSKAAWCGSLSHYCEILLHKDEAVTSLLGLAVYCSECRLHTCLLRDSNLELRDDAVRRPNNYRFMVGPEWTSMKLRANLRNHKMFVHFWSLQNVSAFQSVVLDV